ncbi:MAG: TerB family tellurite resistance protein [Chromatiales bacterium]|nr:TerB family tellurite resistance protein [Chromatiales bacterium]
MREEYADIYAQIESAEDIIADDEKFRKRLGIGADAYRSLKTASWLGPTAFGGVTGAAVASSPIVATTFFGGTASTVAGWLGLGLAATTPVGWVVAAGVVAGATATGAYTLYRKKVREKLIDEVPRQINSPLDVVATSVGGFLMPVALNLALADGSVDDSERREIKDFFVNGWGYSESYAERKLEEFESEHELISLEGLLSALGKFKSHDKDCNFDHISRELLLFLEELANADGEFDHGEKATIDEVKTLLRDHNLLHS